MIRLTQRSSIAAALAFALIALNCAPIGYAASDVSSPSDARITVSDDLGHNVTVRRPPLRIVSLAPAATDMLVAAGAGSQLVGTIEYSGQPASEANLPKIGSAYAIDMERLIALRPDVVVVWPDGNNPAQIATIQRLGLPVYDQEAVTLDGIGESLRRLGRLAGTSAAADREARLLAAKLASLRREYAKRARPPSVFLEVWNRPLYTVGGRELMSDALRVCGARNVFADLPPRPPAIGVEAVLARNPDIIIATAPPGTAAGWLAQWQRFPSLRAVKTGWLMTFEDQRLIGLGPGVIDATGEMCGKIAALTRQDTEK